MTYADDDRSIQDSEPYYLLVATHPGGVARYNNSDINIVFGGNTYAAAQLETGTLLVKPSTEMREYEIRLPIDHPIVVMYKTGGPPPRALLLEVFRYQAVSGTVEREATGYAAGLGLDPKTQTGVFRLPDATDDQMDVLIPTVSLSRTCNAFLFDSRCRLSKPAYTVTTTITSVSLNGLSISVASVGGNFSPYWDHGVLEHVNSTEQRSIRSSFASIIDISLPLRSPQVGDTVKLTPGCDRLIPTCETKYNNVLNFRGHPRAPIQNPFLVGTTSVKAIP